MIYSYSDPSIAHAINVAHEMRAAAVRSAFAALGAKLANLRHNLASGTQKTHTA